jgi:hypothetical protein
MSDLYAESPQHHGQLFLNESSTPDVSASNELKAVASSPLRRSFNFFAIHGMITALNARNVDEVVTTAEASSILSQPVLNDCI